MRIEINPEKQAEVQQLADTNREIMMSVSSDEEKQLKKSLENIVDQLNELGLPYTLSVILPWELERNQIGSLQYNNLSGLILNSKTEEEKVETESIVRYCDFMMVSDTLRFFTNNYRESISFGDIFAIFTQKVFHYFRYIESGRLNLDKDSVIRYFKKLISKR